MRLILFTLFLFLIGFESKSQIFEGVIDFTKTNDGGKVYYKYFVSKNAVRIDEYDEENNNVNAIIVDLITLNSVLLNTSRKLYLELEKNNHRLAKINGVEVIESDSIKWIAGSECKNVIVRDKNDKKEVSFFVSNQNFIFFKSLLIALNRKDIPLLYFQQIPNLENLFPFSAVEKDASGKIINSFEVTSISNSVVDQTLFQVPSDFKKL